MKTNLIKCPETGELLLYDKLFDGERIVVATEDLKNYDLAPRSGVVKALDGTLIDITKKIMGRSSSATDHHHDNKYSKLDHNHSEYALIQNVYTKEDTMTKDEIEAIINTLTSAIVKVDNKKPDVVISATEPIEAPIGTIWIEIGE